MATNPGNSNNNESDSSRNAMFVRLFSMNYYRIHAFILSLTPNITDAEDIMQETSIEIWKKFSEFQPGTDFVAWAVTIAKYKTLSHRKKNANNALLISDEAVEKLCNDATLLHTRLDSRLEALKRCLEKLGKEDRNFIKMKYESGSSTKAIAGKTGLSIYSIYRKLARINTMLLRCVRRTLTEGAGI